MTPRGNDAPARGPVQPDISFSSATRDVTVDSADVHLLDPVTGRVRCLTHAPTPDVAEYWGGDWSPDRSRLVTHGWGAGGRGACVVDAVTGAEQVKVSWGTDVPTWLDDHTLLGVQRGTATLRGDGARPIDEVFTVDLEAWSTRQVTQLGAGVTVHALSWHPAAGLALDVGPADAPAWAGRRTATVSAARVRRAAAGTGVPVRQRDLRHPFGATPTMSPDWSPDGTRLAVVRLHSDAGGWTATDIAVGSVRSGRLTVVVDGSGLDDDGDPARPSMYGPAVWSPDGRSIAWLESYREDWGEIWVAAADGTGSRQVTAFDHREVIVSLDW